MTPRLHDIPTTAAAPTHARPSAVVARIRSYRPSRRAVLRGMLISAAAATLVPIDWYLARRGAAAAPEDTEGDDRSEHLTCRPAEYREESNNWWAGGSAVCYGGWRRGSFPCDEGYHREGAFSGRGELYTSTRLTTNCHGRNAWRWKGFRCSDAVTTVTFDDGTEYTGVTIAACAVEGAPVAADGGSDTGGGDPDSSGSGDSGSGDSDSGDSDSGDSGSGDSGSGDSGGDPSRPPRGLLPDLTSVLNRVGAPAPVAAR
jgi:hypothetical protein